MYHFFDSLSIQHIPFYEYNNFRLFKVSYKDTRTMLSLLTLNRFHTSHGSSKKQLGNYIFRLILMKLYLLRCILYCLLFYYNEQTRLVGLLFKRDVLEFVVKILDKYTNKELLKIPLLNWTSSQVFWSRILITSITLINNLKCMQLTEQFFPKQLAQ